MTDMIDYRGLLIKYIDHVRTCEGTSFLHEHFFGHKHDFSDEEWAELQKLDKESDQ
jgi:hypothetical protein